MSLNLPSLFLSASPFPIFGVYGYSCTIPHKEAALACCDEVDPVAKVVNQITLAHLMMTIDLFKACTCLLFHLKTIS